MKNLFVLTAAVALLVAGAVAQESAPAPVKPNQPFMFVQKSTAQGVGQGMGQGAGQGPEWRVEHPEGDFAGNFVFYSAEMGGDRETVKGSPYTATALTEITQLLADGNRISNKSSASLARDSQGRTRREETLGKIGSLQVNGVKVVSIHDPVAGTEFVFKSGTQPVEEENHPDAKIVRIEEGKRVRVMAGAAAPPGVSKERWREQPGEVKRESLGTQTIEGVSAEGKRETRTIPAGAIGNERPIEITSETWYSPDLHTVVLSKRNDPRMGETVFRLTEIKRGEPDASLFQAPPGSKVNKEKFFIDTNDKEE